jgi:undecaprenyl diphosphate synthase
MELFGQTIENELEELMKNQVKLNFLGRLTQFSTELQAKMRQAMAQTKNNKRITLNVMVNYGGRAELVDAIKGMAKNQLIDDEVKEETISQYLYTKGMPDPDLLIRTANEMRISNFLLWQIAYSEIYVTPTLWPDFRREQLLAAVKDYQSRVRRFGRLS